MSWDKVARSLPVAQGKVRVTSLLITQINPIPISAAAGVEIRIIRPIADSEMEMWLPAASIICVICGLPNQLTA